MQEEQLQSRLGASRRDIHHMQSKENNIRQVFLKYGAHLEECALSYNISEDCTCGFVQALEEI